MMDQDARSILGEPNARQLGNEREEGREKQHAVIS